MITRGDVAALERCLAGGGVALLPTDTLYGLACDPDSPTAVAHLYEIKGRVKEKPAAVMFGSVERALEALPELGEAVRGAMGALLPGPVTLLVPNPRRRFPLACPRDPLLLGVRVPSWPQQLAALGALARPVLQSSANPAGGEDPRRLAEVPEAIRAAVQLALDGGEVPGVASSVIDLRAYGDSGRWELVRRGALEHEAVARALAGRVEPS